MENNRQDIEQAEEIRQEVHQEELEKQETRRIPVRIIVLIALVVILALGILLPIKIVPNALSSIGATLSSLFRRSEPITLSTTPADIQSGQPFILSWTGEKKTDGSYALHYPCVEGVRIESSVGEPKEVITCNSSFYFSPADTSIELTAFSDRNRTEQIPLTLSFLANNASRSEVLADTTITVTNPSRPTTSATSTPIATSTPKTAKKPTPKVTPSSGLPDLEVRAIDVGYDSQKAVLSFVVVNIGDTASGPWTLRATLPSHTDPTHLAPHQQSLAPGDRIKYHLEFKNVNTSGDRKATITADPENEIKEESETNNKTNIFVPTTQGQTGTKPDFGIRILNTGVNAEGRAFARFEVVNLGGRATGEWRFQATLPTTDNLSEYNSSIQSSLASGEKVIFNVGFENARFGTNTITISLDPQNSIDENNESNNTASANVVR